VVVISGIYMIIHLNALNHLIESIIRREISIIKISEEALDDIYGMTAAEDKYHISGDSDYYRQFRQIRSNFNDKVNELNKMADTATKSGILTDIKEYRDRYQVLENGQKSLADNRKLKGRNYQLYLISREQIVREIDQRLRNLAKISTKDRNLKLQQSRDMSNRVTHSITIFEILAVILVIIITFINTQKINLQMKLLGERTKEIAGGKFSSPLEISSPPELKELADSFNVMSERLRELDQMKIDYISHLSHELRTPLTVIKEASLMLQQGVLSKSPEKRDELFEIIKMECERLISSVNRILDLSRMEAGDMFFSFQQASIAAIIEKSIKKLTPLIQGKRMDIQLEISQDIPLLSMDIERIEEVLQNLLGNALKYTPDSGRITISAVSKSEDQTVEISVTDNGIGIPEDGLQQVFDKFKRVDDKRAAIRGTGLGLAIVKYVINAHGGTIWVKSKVGEGSTFTFSLPAV
jgi:two-component system, NtrC family, sensor histidine kinase GlrK